MVSTPRHACKVPELKNYPIDLQFMLSSPESIDSETRICSMMDTNYTKLIIDLDLMKFNETDLTDVKEKIKNYHYKNKPSKYKSCDQGWIYDDKDYDETAVTAVSGDL